VCVLWVGSGGHKVDVGLQSSQLPTPVNANSVHQEAGRANSRSCTLASGLQMKFRVCVLFQAELGLRVRVWREVTAAVCMSLLCVSSQWQRGQVSYTGKLSPTVRVALRTRGRAIGTREV